MAYKHLSRLPDGISINLIVGMTGQSGIGKGVHNAFKKLELHSTQKNFKCRYISNNIPVHTKAYAWYKEDIPIIGFTGSANYSQGAFLGHQEEAVAEDDAHAIFNYYNKTAENSIRCTDENIEDFINIERMGSG